LGLGPAKKWGTKAIPFFENLNNQGNVPYFGISLTSWNNTAKQPSQIFFGADALNQTERFTGALIPTNYTQDNQFWTAPYNGGSYEKAGSRVKNVGSEQKGNVTLDSTSGNIYLTQTEFTAYRKEMEGIDGIECSSLSCYSETKSCAEIIPQMEVLKIVIFNTTFTIPAEGLCVSDYMWPVNNKIYSAYIPISTGLTKPTEVVLGTPFFRAFYVVFSLNPKQVNFAVNAFSDYSKKTSIDVFNNPMSWTTIGLIFGGVVLFFLLITLGVCCCKRRRNKDDGGNSDSEDEEVV